MDIQVVSKTVKQVVCDALVVGAVRTKTAQAATTVVLSETAKSVDDLLDGLIQQICADGEFKGNLGEITTIYTMGKLAAKRVIVVGLGAQETAQALRRASSIAARHLQNTGAHHIALALNREQLNVNAAQGVQAQVEGALLGLYTFKKYQHSNDNGNGRGIRKISIVAGEANKEDVLGESVRRGSTLAEATNFARDLVNEPPNVLTPTELANRASTMARQFGLECEILDRPQMQELGMGGLLAVAQGSVEPPKFIILRYRGVDSTDKGMALVGKGITFDTGGISIKPAAGMDEMKGDMAGAAAVIGAMQAIAQLKPAINVTALVSTTENMPSGTAYRPGDIIRILNGKSIEIVNTDAEGRLVLADALSYASKEGLSPIIDVATRTGGSVIAR